MKQHTATERGAAKAAGPDLHPANNLPVLPAAQLADQAAEQPKRAALKHLGGSERDEFNISLAESVLSSAWITSNEDRAHLLKITGHALAGIAPRDELEGLLAGQMVAAHQASMECYRRAMIPSQSAQHRDQNLTQAAKASRTYAALLETLNRHRNKGQQRVVVEHVHRHVHVHEGGPTVAQTETPGDGAQIESTSQPHAQRAIGYALQPSLRSEDQEREPVPRTSDAEREVPNARRN